MMDIVPALAKAHLTRSGRLDEVEAAALLVGEYAPGESPSRWVRGGGEDEYQLWVATERRVVMLEQEFRQRSMDEVGYAELEEVCFSRDQHGARVRLYARGWKHELEEADVARAEGFVQWVRQRIPPRRSYAALHAEQRAPPSRSTAVERQLADLASLHQRGLLSEEEYYSFEQQLLDR